MSIQVQKGMRKVGYVTTRDQMEFERPSFWTTLPGILTAVAGTVSAITALVVALTQTGIFKDREATPLAAVVPSSAVQPSAAVTAPAAAVPSPAATPPTPAAAPLVSGAWRAQVTYSWGLAMTERFVFQADGSRLTGTVTFLGVPRGIQDGVVEGNTIRFSVRTEEIIGDERRWFEMKYRGTVVGGGLHFELDDSRGNPSIQFAASRQLAAP